MLVKFLESKNILLLRLFLLALLILVLVFAGLPNNPADYFSLFLFVANLFLAFVLLQENEAIHDPTYGVFTICCFAIVFSESIYNLQINACLLFLLGTYIFLVKILESDEISHSLEIGFFLTFACLAFLPSILFLFAFPLFLIFKVDEWLNSLVLFLMGIFSSVLFTIQIFYLFNLDYLSYFLNIIQINPILYDSELLFLSPLLLFCLYCFVSHFLSSSFIEKKNKSQFSLLSIFTISWVIVLLFYAGSNYEWFFVLFFPASVFNSKFLLVREEDNGYKEFALWFLVFSVVLYLSRSYILDDIFPIISDQISLIQEIFHQIWQRYSG